MEPESPKQILMKQEIEDALAECEALESECVELEEALTAKRARLESVRESIWHLDVLLGNTGLHPDYDQLRLRIASRTNGSSHSQVRRIVLSRPDGISRIELKDVLPNVNDKTLDNVLFRLCRSGEVRRDEYRRGFYLPGYETKSSGKK